MRRGYDPRKATELIQSLGCSRARTASTTNQRGTKLLTESPDQRGR